MKFINRFKAKCKFCIILIMSVLAMFACTDDEFNLKKVNSDIVYDPKLAFTIGTVNIELFDMLSDYGSDFLKEDADGTLRVLFERDIISYRGLERISIPGQAPVSLPALLFPPTFPSTQVYRDSVIDVPIVFNSDQRIDSMIAKTMNISVIGTSNYTYNGELTITLESMKKGNTPFSVKIPIPKATAGSFVNINSKSDSQLANGYKMVFNSTTPGSSKLPARVGLTLFGNVGQAIDPTQNISLNITIGDLTYTLMYGYVGNYTIMDVTDSLDMSFLGRSIANNIEWKDPGTKFYFDNSYSMPVKVNIENMTVHSGISNTSVVATPGGNVNPKDLAYPSGPYLFKKDSMVFNKTNSPSLYSSIEKSPRSLDFKIKANCNPQGPTIHNNILMDTSVIRGKLVFDLPIYFRSSGFGQSEIMEFDLMGSSGGSSSDYGFESMLFRIVSENDMPVDMLLQVEFLDENNKHLGDLFNTAALDNNKRIIKASEVDANGDLVKPTQFKYDIVLNEAQLKLLEKTKKLKYTTTMVSSGYDTKNLTGPYVRFKNNYNLKMTFVCQFQPKIKL